MADARFINVDFDLQSNVDLSLLIGELGESVVITANYQEKGVHYLSMELAGLSGDADYLMGEYANLIENLSTQTIEIVRQCIGRSFDFGYEGVPADMTPTLQAHLSIESVLILAKLNASMAVTTYWRSEDLATYEEFAP